MKQPCGCCAGIQIITPESEINRPGLPALAYRAGTYATFFETMLARLSNLCIEAPSLDGSGTAAVFPLRPLTTRELSDPSIALLDAWAIVADVLTFYQERIANEGYLRTAVERRSVLELARLVGYRLRPGVASSVYLAFTVSNGFKGDIPAGTRAQSIPGTGETPQFFETSDKLAARDSWNNLIMRLTRPQMITPPGTDSGDDDGPLATGADVTDALYFQGISTNLKVGDALLFVLGDDTNAKPAQQVLRFVEAVHPQPDQKRTQVTLVQPPAEVRKDEKIDGLVQGAIQPFINKANTLFPGSDLARSVASALVKLIRNVQAIASINELSLAPPPPSPLRPGIVAANFIRGVIPLVEQNQDIAVKRNFTRLAAWAGHLLQTLRALVEQVQNLPPGASKGSLTFQRSTLEASPLGKLFGTLGQLALAPSVQPANSQRLPRTIKQAFGPASDIAPRLLAVFKPAAASTLYQAWANVETPPSRATVYALRAKASVFGHNAPRKPVLDASGRVIGSEEWPIKGSTTLGVVWPLNSGQGTVFIKIDMMTYSSAIALGTTVNLRVGSVEMSLVGAEIEAGVKFVFLLNTTNQTTISVISISDTSAAAQIDGGPQLTVGDSQSIYFSVKDSTITLALADGTLTVTDESPLAPSALNTALLDVQYDKILPDSWAVFVRADDRNFPTPKIRRVTNVQTVSPSDYGITGTVTKLTLNDDWLTSTDRDLSVFRQTTIYAQSEALELAEEPLDRDVENNTVELADLYDGLESGRWVFVSGARTDIPNVSGVTASELVMIAGLNQGSQAPLCAVFPSGFVPFAKIDYTTDANVFGDRLVVGVLSSGASAFINDKTLLPLPTIPDQTYCDQVQLAPGVYVNAYVPKEEERTGKFSDFRGLLVDPDKKVPYPDGTIGPPADGKTFAWRISSEPVHTILTLASPLAYKYDASTVNLSGNVVKATHGQTVAEVLGNGAGSQAFQTFALHQSPLTYTSAPTPAGAESTLEVRVNEIEWHEADNLAALGPTDRGYITQTNDADQTSVIFGNGEHGALTPTGNVNIKAIYRYGIGKPGNVQAQQISQLATRPLGVQGVINPLPATGGADRDSADQARRNTPLAVKALDRLVGVEDYADFARTFAGIGKAAAARLSDGRRQLVHVTIAGADDIPIDVNSDLYRNLAQALRQYGDPSLPIQVCVRKVKLLVISAAMRVLPSYQWESVEPNIRAALLDAFSFDSRDLGQSAFLSEAVSVMQAVEGVAYVDIRAFDGVPEDITAGELAGLGRTLGPKPFVEADLASVDPSADPAKPCERVRPAELVFLTPDIPDTLILTEIGG
jgi:hypothetical protein